MAEEFNLRQFPKTSVGDDSSLRSKAFVEFLFGQL